MSRFEKASEDLVFETKKGKLTIDKNSYLKVVEENKNDCLIITKAGTQTIKDFFEVVPKLPQINQQWNNNSNFNIIVMVEVETKEYGSAYGCASANPLNLGNKVAQSYPVEMGVKRAEATACLELLRKNYTGKESVPLLYSSFDEFNAENSINNPDEPKNIKKPTNNTKKEVPQTTQKTNNTEVKSGQTTTTQQDDKNIIDPNSVNKEFSKTIFTKKYPEGTTLINIYNTDKEYFKKIVVDPNKYRDFATKLLTYIGVTVEEL